MKAVCKRSQGEVSKMLLTIKERETERQRQRERDRRKGRREKKWEKDRERDNSYQCFAAFVQIVFNALYSTTSFLFVSPSAIH